MNSIYTKTDPLREGVCVNGPHCYCVYGGFDVVGHRIECCSCGETKPAPADYNGDYLVPMDL